MALTANSELTVEATLVDQDDAVIKLDNFTVTFRYWFNESGAVTERTATKTNETGGVAEYQFTEGELVSGKLQYEWRLDEISGNSYTSTEIYTEIVRPVLGAAA